MNSINNLPAEIICEIFDKDPGAVLQLARTNKWFSEVLKDKIKKYRQLIRECNSASICYSNSFHKILAKEYREAGKHNSEVTSSYVCYFYCVHCFCSFEYGFFTFYFLVRSLNETHETGIILCDECSLKYYDKRINERIKTLHSVSIHDLIYDDSDDSSDDSSNDNGSLDFEDYE